MNNITTIQNKPTTLFNKKRLILLLVLGIALLLATTSAHASAPIVPDGLSAAEWGSIQAQIAAAEYQFSATDNGWAATNRAQGWQTNFGSAGAQVSAADGAWTWGLTLQSYGYGENLAGFQNLVGLTADKETVTYQWDKNLSEWWVNSAAGLEQGFNLQERPEGRAQGQPGQMQNLPLQVNMVVSGDLTPVMDGGGDVLFQNAAGETILRYDRLYVVDANGQTIPARLILHPSSFILHPSNCRRRYQRHLPADH